MAFPTKLGPNTKNWTTDKNGMGMKPIVQVSLDLIDIDEPLEMAHTAVRAGVDWL